MDIKITAEVYRLGILIGLYTVQDVIKWADQIIAQLENPPYAVIELSLSLGEKPVDVCSKLNAMSGCLENNDFASKIILGLLNGYFLSTNNGSDVYSMLSRISEHLQLEESNKWMKDEIFFLTDGLSQ